MGSKSMTNPHSRVMVEDFGLEVTLVVQHLHLLLLEKKLASGGAYWAPTTLSRLVSEIPGLTELAALKALSWLLREEIVVARDDIGSGNIHTGETWYTLEYFRLEALGFLAMRNPDCIKCCTGDSDEGDFDEAYVDELYPPSPMPLEDRMRAYYAQHPLADCLEA